MNKKAIIILAAIFLLIVGTLGFLIYSRSSSTEEQPPVVVDSTNTLPDPVDQTTSPLPAPEKFSLLTQAGEQVVSPALFYNGNGVTYLSTQGQLMKADFETSVEGGQTLARSRNLDIQQKSNIARILWPKNGDDFIAESEDSVGNKSYSYFNFSTGAYLDLPKEVTALEWLPSGDKIIFVWVAKDADGNEKATLNIANPDTSGYSQIAELYESDDALYLSPDGLNLVFHRAKNTGSVNKIIQTTPDGKIWKDLVKEGYNYGILWSPDSQKLLFGKLDRSGLGYQLWYYDLYSGEVKNLGLSTVPLKAVWGSDSRTVYAAAPNGGQAIRDYADLNNTFTADTFYKIDTSTLEKTEYLPENLTVDGRDLFLNPGEDKVFFRNAQDGGLYYLDLTQ